MTNIKDLLENKEFMTGLVEVETPEALGKLLEANGIVLEEGLTLEDAFKMVKDQENGELDETALEDVSGGIALTLALTSAGLLIASGGMLCFLGGYAYQSIKKGIKKRK